jgi:hypothetical protein
MSELLWLVRIAELVALLLGGGIALTAYRAYRRNRDGALLLAALGFTLLFLGAISEGVLFELAGYGLLESRAVRSWATAVGFLVIFVAIRRVK